MEFCISFYNRAYNPAAITQADINEYVSRYSVPGGMHAGFEYFRAVLEDAIQNQNYSKTKLTMLVLAMGAGYTRIGGDITMPSIGYGMDLLFLPCICRLIPFLSLTLE